MASYIQYINRIRKREGLPELTEGEFEHDSINEARRKVGLPELICKRRRCIACGKGFKSFDASHRVCDKCRPKWERKRGELEKALINIEDTDTFDFQDLEDLSIFEDIS
ncbi:MAG: hypothetical protein ABID54_04990 [Pseudomonadota bacterium]